MADRKPVVIDHRSGPLFQHVAPMLDGPPDNFPRYLLSRELDTRYLLLVIRGASSNNVTVKIRYGNRHRKLDGTIEYVLFHVDEWTDLKDPDLRSVESAIIQQVEMVRKPIDWIEIAAWCTSPLEGNYISVKVSASEMPG